MRSYTFDNCPCCGAEVEHIIGRAEVIEGWTIDSPEPFPLGGKQAKYELNPCGHVVEKVVERKGHFSFRMRPLTEWEAKVREALRLDA